MQGFCRDPLFCEPKGDEKSFTGNPAGSTPFFATGEFAAIRSKCVFRAKLNGIPA